METDPPTVTWHDGPSEPMPFHEYANLFPLLEGDAYWSLVEDIRQNGVQEPIVKYGPAILDGRNRYLGSRECDRPYPTVEFVGDDPLAFVISKNLARRHLSESQRAMIAAKLANLRGGGRSSTPSIDGVSQGSAATALNVGVASVERAAAVQTRGTPELVASVQAGDVSVSAAAEVAKLPENLQAAILVEGPEAVRAVAAELREARQGGGPTSQREAIAQGALRRVATSRRGGGPRRKTMSPDAAATVVVRACRSIADVVRDHGVDNVALCIDRETLGERSIESLRAGQTALMQVLRACNASAK